MQDNVETNVPTVEQSITLLCLVMFEDDGWVVVASDSRRSRATILPVKA